MEEKLKANKYAEKLVDLPPETMLITREADYVVTPTLRHEPITSGVHISNVRIDRTARDGEQNVGTTL